MDFALTPEQELLRDSARAVLTKECPVSLVRAHIDDPSAADAVWEHIGEWVGLAQGPLVDLCLFMEEAGAVLLPGPFFATTALFAPLLGALDHALLPTVVTGETTGAVALAGGAGEWTLSDDPVRTFVLEADRVDRVALVLAGPRALVTERLPARQVPTLDTSRRVFEVSVPVATDAAVEIDPAALNDVVERATVALAAELVGTTRHVLETTVEYAKARVQFDRPIGSFQAIQHTIVDMALDLERAVSAVYYAAMTVDADDPDRRRAVHVAKAAAGEAAKRVAKDALQIHGGIGYTWEHDLHLYLRRAYASEPLLGTTSWHHDRLGDLLLA